MRALSLSQPWADVVVNGPKRIENRPVALAGGASGRSSTVELRDVAAQSVPLRPRRELDEGADQVVIRAPRKQLIAAAAKVLIGPAAPADESPLPCVPVDLAALGGKSFDIGRAWRGGDVRAIQQQPAATSRVKESLSDE